MQRSDPMSATVDVTPEPGGRGVKVLLARFHPLADDSQIVVVGRVVCDAGTARLDAASLTGIFSAPASLLIKLRYLIEHAAPEPFDRLRKLRSQFWSFVDVSHDPRESGEKESDA
jgi:hypothetical protein